MSPATQSFWQQGAIRGHAGVISDRRDVVKHNQKYADICEKGDPSAKFQFPKPDKSSPVPPKPSARIQ